MDREKVIKGLELCATGSECTGRDCPYWHNVLDDAIKGCDCTTELVRDALALLKEQEVKTGYWIIVEYETLTCSCCGKSYYTGCDSTKEAIANLEKGNVYCYCPYCGSKMEGR